MLNPWCGRYGRAEAYMFACCRGASGVAGSLLSLLSPPCRYNHTPRLSGTRYFPSQPKRLHELYIPGVSWGDLATILTYI